MGLSLSERLHYINVGRAQMTDIYGQYSGSAVDLLGSKGREEAPLVLDALYKRVAARNGMPEWYTPKDEPSGDS